MDKSPEAFRTISEVAESLETPAHVLRFWESRFPQIKPVKRAGGRRYYRPADVALLGGIRHLLHDEGMTIRGVQKILREQGVRHVAGMAADSEGVEFDADLLDAENEGIAVADDIETTEPEAETAQVFALETVVRAAPAVPAIPATIPAEVVQLRAVPEPQGIPLAAAAPVEAGPVEAGPVEAGPVEDAPEAGHIWVEDEPELELSSPALQFPSAAPVAEFKSGAGVGEIPIAYVAPTEAPSADAPFMPMVPEGAALHLSGIAARLRALPRPISASVVAGMMELHSRLGLLHAQMSEAQRLRR